MAREIRRVALVTTLDSSDINNWSGIFVHLYEALSEVFPEVVRIGPLKSVREPIGVAKRLLSWRQGKDHPLWLTKATAHGYARQVEREIERLKPDAIFSVWHPQIAYLKTDLPVFMFQDSPFITIQNAYEEMHRFTDGIMRDVEEVERAAAERCTGIIETSDWAREEGLKLWKLPPERIASIPFGANLETDLDVASVEKVIQERDHSTCRLVWLGKDWVRKGGDIALEATRILNEQGLKTELLVIGTAVPEDQRAKAGDQVNEVGFIDKRTPEGRRRMQELLKSSHFLILPTQAEAFGIVYVEANAFAVPSLGPNVMGVASAVLSGENGVLLPKGADAAAYAEVIKTLMEDRARYQALCRSSFKAYQEKFNWSAVGRRIRDFMLERIESGSPAGTA